VFLQEENRSIIPWGINKCPCPSPNGKTTNPKAKNALR